MLAPRVQRMCKYIFKCVLVCCFLLASFLPPHPQLTLSPVVAGESGLLSWSAVPLSADQYVPCFSTLSLPPSLSFRGEDTAGSKCRQTAWRSQRVGTSLISNFPSSSHFLNNEFVQSETGDNLHWHQTTAPVFRLPVTWHRADARVAARRVFPAAAAAASSSCCCSHDHFLVMRF